MLSLFYCLTTNNSLRHSSLCARYCSRALLLSTQLTLMRLLQVKKQKHKKRVRNVQLRSPAHKQQWLDHEPMQYINMSSSLGVQELSSIKISFSFLNCTYTGPWSKPPISRSLLMRREDIWEDRSSNSFFVSPLKSTLNATLLIYL